MTPLLEARGVSKSFPVRRGALQRLAGSIAAVDRVDLDLLRGECYALVGESGSGKTTLGRCLIRLIEPTDGTVRFGGEDLSGLGGADLRRKRRHFQMIFQDPYGSLNPRMRIGRALSEPLRVHRIVRDSDIETEVARLLDEVGLPGDTGTRFPHEFSGGQRQRIGIARALTTRPQLLIADEPVSALDVSVQAQIVNLLIDLQEQRDLALLFIGHDLALVEKIADRVGVMYLGRIVEEAPARHLFERAQHPYTASLLSAVPVPDPERRHERIMLPGEPPSALSAPSGCRFQPRCPIARPECLEESPQLVEISSAHKVACHYPGELDWRTK